MTLTQPRGTNIMRPTLRSNGPVRTTEWLLSLTLRKWRLRPARPCARCCDARARDHTEADAIQQLRSLVGRFGPVFRRSVGGVLAYSDDTRLREVNARRRVDGQWYAIAKG